MSKRTKVKVRRAIKATKQTLSDLAIGAAYALKN
tara:strand:- start:769 stop:870 length:102 start_codon:yes stop_codon:yes gene_type:complete